MTVQQAVEEILSWPRLSEDGASLERMHVLLRELGDPQKELRFVHIAGTNGKGTVAALTASVLRQAGYRTGLTISPYVLEFRERFQINGEMIPKRMLAVLAGQVMDAARRISDRGGVLPVQFEIVTAIALLWFAREKCDIVVMETGLGGRFDATNAVENTLVAAVTCIGLDHTELLGETLTEIAGEKAGIFKPGCTVVCYPEQPPEALAVLRAQAEELGCEWVRPEPEDLTCFKGRALENPLDYGGYRVDLPFPGKHQANNAAMAVEICLALWRKGFSISDDAILQGLAQAQLPARIEVLCRHPLVVLDGSHNPDGVRALAGTLAESGYGEDCRLVGVMGVLKEKNVTAMLEELQSSFDKVFAVTPDSPRALPAAELADLARYYFDVEACADLRGALKKALAEDCQGIVICGSLYLAAEARPLLQRMLR